MITPDKIEMWKKDPAKWDYARGYNEASLDVWNQPEPIVFTDKHSKSFRRGYRQGWAEQKAHLLIDQVYKDEFNDELFIKLAKDEHSDVCTLTMQTALVPDSDVPEYFEDDWKQVIHLLEHPEEAKVKRRVYHKNGMVIREDYD